MARRITFFSLFLSIVFGLVIGVYKYPVFTCILFHVIFFILVIFSYRIFLIFEKLGVLMYESYIRQWIEKISNIKEKADELQKPAGK